MTEYAESGAEQAFEQVVARHGSMVYGVCLRVLGNKADADDAAQAVFLTLSTKAADVCEHPSIPAWLHRVAWHISLRARSSMRHRHRAESVARTMAPSPKDRPLDPLADARAVLDREIEALPETYRSALILHHLHGLTLGEVAQKLGCRESAASMRITRGREQLRRRFARLGFAVSITALSTFLAQAASASEGSIRPLSTVGTGVAATGRAIAWSQGFLHHALIMLVAKGAVIVMVGMLALGLIADGIVHLARHPGPVELLSKSSVTPVVIEPTVVSAGPTGPVVPVDQIPTVEVKVPINPDAQGHLNSQPIELGKAQIGPDGRLIITPLPSPEERQPPSTTIPP